MQSPPVKLPAKEPISWLWGLDHLAKVQTDQLSFYESLAQRYGDAVCLRFGPYRTWFFFHPDPIQELLTRQSDNLIRFKPIIDVIRQWNGDSLLVAEGESWKKRRRKVLPALQTKRLPNYGKTVVQLATNLCDSFDSQASNTGMVQIDTDSVMARLVLDISATSLFGNQPFNNGNEIERAIHVLSDTAFRESTSPFTLPDFLPLKSKRDKRWAMRVADDMVTRIVQQRLNEDSKENATDRGDLLSMLVEHHEGDALAIRNDSMSLLIASHETSGALLSWVFAMLVEHPSILHKITEEIETVLQGRLPEYSDFKELNYVRAVVEETLRLYPTAYALFTRTALKDLTLAGINIRKGDNVHIVPYTLHRSARWFNNPEEFQPTRFLNEPTWPKYAYLPFGAGPRVCIGQNFALMEACLALTTILQRWHPTKTDSKTVPEAKFSLRPKGGLLQTWTRV